VKLQSHLRFMFDKYLQPGEAITFLVPQSPSGGFNIPY